MNRVRVFHIRMKELPNTAATLAIRKMDDGMYRYGMGLCSPDDQFSKRRGRLIATGREEKRGKYAPTFDYLIKAIKHDIRAAWVPGGRCLDADILCKLVDERMERTRAFAEAK